MAAKGKEMSKDISQFNGWWRVFAFAFGVLVSVSVVVFAFQQLTRPDVLPIKELRVTGEFSQVKAEDLRSIVEARLEGNFFTVDVDRIHQAIADLEWVSFVWVDRIWPNVLQVRVLEQKPVGIWNSKQLINENAVVFASVTEGFDNLPSINGPEGMQSQVMNVYRDISKSLSAHDLTLKVLNMDKRKALNLEFGNGVVVLMGREDVRHRLDRFLNIYTAQLTHESDRIKQIDLRYSNGFALSKVEEKRSAVGRMGMGRAV